MIKKTCLYLDDVRTPDTQLPGYEPWVIVRNYEEFVSYIKKNGIPDLISFDHDLADEHMEDYFSQKKTFGFQNPDYSSYSEYTGFHCAKWLVNHLINNPELELKECYSHSYNPVGRQNIISYINSYKKSIGEPQDCEVKIFSFKIN